MRLLHLLLISTFILGSHWAWARSDEEWDSEAIHESTESIQRALDVLKNGGKGSSGCNIPQSPSCTFAAYCSAFKGKSDSVYLYENEQGRKIPNFPLMKVFNSLEACMGSTNPQYVNDDPFLYPEKFDTPKNKELWKKENARVTKLYEETKARLVKVLSARKNGQNDSQIDTMIKRVQTVKMKMPPVGNVEKMVTEGCESPNAFYAIDDHTFTLCPQTFNFPDASLMSTISHELAHSIDPCHCAQDLVKDGDSYGVDYAYDPIQKKALAPKTSNPEVKGMGLASNPMASVISCLQSDSSIGVKMPTVQELQKDLDQYAKGLKKESGGLSNSNPAIQDIKAQRDQIPKLYDRYGGCEIFTENGHIGEAFADWASAQVLADKVKEISDSGKAKQFVFESQSLFLGTSCKGLFGPLQDKVVKLLDADNIACGGAFFDYDRFEISTKGHPVSADRMTKIIYAQPELQKALGCSPGKAKACQ